MKVIINIEVMINGMPYVENYSIDGFKLVAKPFYSHVINDEHDDFVFYMNMNLIDYVFKLKTNQKDVYYSVLFKSEQIEFDIDENDENLKKKIEDLSLNYIGEKVIKLERKLRLITNYSIYLPIIKLSIKRINGEDVTSVSLIRHLFKPREELSNHDHDVVLNRARMWIDLTFIENLENENTRFKKAMEMFDSLFMIDNIQTRFVLAFTALEVLLLLDETNITNNLSDSISKIMMHETRRESKKTKHKIIDFYNKRSRFIHDAELTVVTEKNEKDLREILRKVLLIYFFISKTWNYTNSEEVVLYLNETTYETLDRKIKIFITALRDISLEELNAFAESIPSNNKKY